MRYCFIDPGLEGTGWAIFEETPRKPQPNKLHASGVIRSGQMNKTNQMRQIADDLHAALMLHTKQDSLLVIEHPELWGGSEISYAAVKGGNLFKLCRLVGAIEVQWLTARRPPLFVFPREWKGQLGKDVVIERIVKRLSYEPRNHEGDAIGMGLSLLEDWGAKTLTDLLTGKRTDDC